MPTPHDIVTFTDDEPPAGESPWVIEPVAADIAVVSYDESWPVLFMQLEKRIHKALGARALEILHVGSTSVPGLAAKPVIDIDVIVADPAEEQNWLGNMERAGFVLTVREPWWHEHRMLKSIEPAGNIHVFGPDAPEPWKHRIFRDHLRRDESDREQYAKVKSEAATQSNSVGETVMQYNQRKHDVIQSIYQRAFAAAGFLS